MGLGPESQLELCGVEFEDGLGAGLLPKEKPRNGWRVQGAFFRGREGIWRTPLLGSSDWSRSSLARQERIRDAAAYSNILDWTPGAWQLDKG